jgi:prepilin-type N-terminal cleavage/methylation domain-containing protein
VVTRRRRTEGGMTLVEIMITLVISSIIAASTFMFFAGQQRIYDTQTKILNIQQNLWAAMEVVARYARASGSGMYECVRPASYSNGAPPQNGARLLSTSPSDSPLTPNLANRPNTGLRANTPGTNTMQWIPPLWIVNNSTTDTALNVATNTDILTVAFGNRTSGTDYDAKLALAFASTAPATTLSLSGTSMGSMFRQWEFILLLVTPDWGYGNDPNNDRGCTLLQVTTADPNTTSTLDHTATADPKTGLTWNPPGNVGGMLVGGGYVGGSAGVRNFGSLTWVSFFIQRVGQGVPFLMMQQRHLGGNASQPQVLAEGIEDLQIAFACDTGSIFGANLAQVNGDLDEGSDAATRKTDEWWNNVPGDTLPLQGSQGFCNLPTAIRITLVARTLSPDDLIDPAVSGNGPLDVEDHQYAAPRPTDQFRRRVLTTTVYPRNNKPL